MSEPTEDKLVCADTNYGDGALCEQANDVAVIATSMNMDEQDNDDSAVGAGHDTTKRDDESDDDDGDCAEQYDTDLNRALEALGDFGVDQGIPATPRGHDSCIWQLCAARAAATSALHAASAADGGVAGAAAHAQDYYGGYRPAYVPDDYEGGDDDQEYGDDNDEDGGDDVDDGGGEYGADVSRPLLSGGNASFERSFRRESTANSHGDSGSDMRSDAFDALRDPTRLMASARESRAIQAFCDRLIVCQSRADELTARARKLRGEHLTVVAFLAMYMREKKLTCVPVLLPESDRVRIEEQAESDKAKRTRRTADNGVRFLNLVESRSTRMPTAEEMNQAVALVDRDLVIERARALMAKSGIDSRGKCDDGGGAVTSATDCMRAQEMRRIEVVATKLASGRRGRTRPPPLLIDLFLDVLDTAISRARRATYSVNFTREQPQRLRDADGEPRAKRPRANEVAPSGGDSSVAPETNVAHILPPEVLHMAYTLYRLTAAMRETREEAARIRRIMSAINEDLPTVDDHEDDLTGAGEDDANSIEPDAISARGTDETDDVGTARGTKKRPNVRERQRRPTAASMSDELAGLVGVPLRGRAVAARPSASGGAKVTQRAKKLAAAAESAQKKVADHARFAPLRDTISGYLRRAAPRERFAEISMVAADGDTESDSQQSGEGTSASSTPTSARGGVYRLAEVTQERSVPFTAAQRRASAADALREAVSRCNTEEASTNKTEHDNGITPAINLDAELKHEAQACVVWTNPDLIVVMAQNVARAVAEHKASAPKRRKRIIRLQPLARDPHAALVARANQLAPHRSYAGRSGKPTAHDLIREYAMGDDADATNAYTEEAPVDSAEDDEDRYAHEDASVQSRDDPAYDAVSDGDYTPA